MYTSTIAVFLATALMASAKPMFQVPYSQATTTTTSVYTTTSTTPYTTSTSIIGGCGGTQYPSACCAAQLGNPNAVWDNNLRKCVIDTSCGSTNNPNACCVARFGPNNQWSDYYHCCVPIKVITVTSVTVTVPCQQCAPTTVTYTSTSSSTCPPTITYTTIVPPPLTTYAPPPAVTTVVPPPAPPATCVPITVTKTVVQQCHTTVYLPAASCALTIQSQCASPTPY